MCVPKPTCLAPRFSGSDRAPHDRRCCCRCDATYQDRWDSCYVASGVHACRPRQGTRQTRTGRSRGQQTAAPPPRTRGGPGSPGTSSLLPPPSLRNPNPAFSPEMTRRRGGQRKGVRSGMAFGASRSSCGPAPGCAAEAEDVMALVTMRNPNLNPEQGGVRSNPSGREPLP